MAASPDAMTAAGTGGLSALVQQTAEQFGVNWPDLLAQMISFLIVALLLRRFAFKPLLRLLDEHYKGKRDNSRKIWTIYMFLIWYDIYFAGDDK